MKGLLDVMGKSDDMPGSLSRSGDNQQVEKSLEDDTQQAGFTSAAQDCFQALNAGDESGFKDALQAAIEMAR